VIEHGRQGEDTLLHDEKASAVDAVLDRAVAYPETSELRARDPIELAARKLCDPSVLHYPLDG